ncbi:hypothetical protein HED50_12710 [Ochrobactrum oryzae]|nr:hypothetical protein [Brucella oryzae]
MEVAAGGALGGKGTIIDNAVLDAGGATLVGREGQTLTFEKGLTLAGGNNINVALGAPTTVGLFNVKGSLTLAGTLNVTDLGSFGPGLYRIFDYSGAFTDNGLVLGTVPGGPSGMSIQTAIANQVNLVNAAGMTLNYWDGGDPALHGNNQIDGERDMERGYSRFGLDRQGRYAEWTMDQWRVCHFAGKAGTVTVDNTAGAVSAAGMQFSTDGYRLEGDALTLSDTTNNAMPIVRVDKDITATIAAELQGTQGLNKTDFGTLVLTGANSYTGGTKVSEGTLQIGDGGTTGSIVGDVVLDQTAHDVGTFAFNRSNSLTFGDVVSGAGRVVQAGSGTTVLTGTNSYSGGTAITAGTLSVGADNNLAAAGGVEIGAGTLQLSAAFNSGRAITLSDAASTIDNAHDNTLSGVVSHWQADQDGRWRSGAFGAEYLRGWDGDHGWYAADR